MKKLVMFAQSLQPLVSICNPHSLARDLKSLLGLSLLTLNKEAARMGSFF